MSVSRAEELLGRAEFPDSRLDGDEDRVERFRVGGGTVAMIGANDLYLDRLRQATATA